MPEPIMTIHVIHPRPKLRHRLQAWIDRNIFRDPDAHYLDWADNEQSRKDYLKWKATR